MFVFQAQHIVDKLIVCNIANVGKIIMKLDDMTCKEVHDYGVTNHGKCIANSGLCE
jgi:hypothetical protein